MKTSFNTGEVSLRPIQGVGRGVKIGAEQAGFTEKRRSATAKWFDLPCGGDKIVENGPQQIIDTVKNKSNVKSRLEWIRCLLAAK